MSELLDFARGLAVIFGVVALVWLFQKAIGWFENH
jgi:hypothetical protein